MKIPPRCCAWLCWAAIACGTGGSDPGSAPARLEAASGDGQVGAAGQALGSALTVRVLDSVGNAQQGIAVAWRPVGGGSVEPARGVTGSDGVAAAVRTLGTNAGPQGTTAEVPGLTPVSFHHTAQIQGATEILAGSPLTRSDSVKSAAPFSAIVRDQTGAPVPGVVVTWSAGGGGSVSRTADTTDASGRTAVILTLSEAARVHSARVEVPGLIGSPLTFVDSASAGEAVSLSRSGGGGQVAPVLTTLSSPHGVLVRDAYGNPKAGVLVAWRVGDGGGFVSGMSAASAATGPLGIATVTRTLGPTAGVQGDTAFVPGLAGSPVVFADTAGALFTIQVGNTFFTPQLDTVPAGSFLRFQWITGGTLHNVTWDVADPSPLPPNSPNESALNATFMARVLGIGTYRYYCSFHGGTGSGVAGVVVSR